MDWVIFALLAAFFDATYYLLIKKHASNVNPYALFTKVFFFAGILSLIVSYIKGFPALGSNFYPALIITIVTNAVAAILYFKALEKTDLSVAVPMLSFTPVFLILISFLILGEIPSWIGAIGIFVVVIGSYVLNSTKDDSGIFAPLRSIFRDRGTIYMLIVAFLYSITTTYGKMLLENSDFIFGSTIVYFCLGAVFLIMLQMTQKKNSSKSRGGFWLVVLLGAATALSSLTVNIAFMTQIVPYVTSVKRLSILFSVFYGDFLLKEKNMIRRIIGATIMVVGVILILIT